jgi:glycosyltransferase involved in cell wall biosynthesis
MVRFGEPGPFVLAAGGGPLGALRRKLDRLPLLAYPGQSPAPFTPAVAHGDTRARVRAAAPDLVHLHWIADGFLRIEDLPALGRPLVWTLHDSWAFTGGCHVPQSCVRYRESCGSCPSLGSTRDRDLSRRVWERKRRAWEDLPVALVAPSRWLASCAEASTLLGGRSCRVIPNGLDLERFRPGDREAWRDRLGLPRDRRIVLSGGVNVIEDSNKGHDLLVDALRRLPAMSPGLDLEWVVYGSPAGIRLPDVPFPARSLGIVTDEATMTGLLGASDVFVAPSRQENLPNTILEAMACGLPAVAFESGGIPDLIEHRRTGWMAPPFDAGELARGIAWVLEEEPRRRALGELARRRAEQRFDLALVARRYAELYDETRSASRAEGASGS